MPNKVILKNRFKGINNNSLAKEISEELEDEANKKMLWKYPKDRTEEEDRKEDKEDSDH